MATSKEIHYLRGKLFWAKVIGEPVDNYGKDGKEWVFDLALDPDGVKQVKSIKVNGKPAMTLKNKDDDRGDFVTFKQKYRELPAGRNGEQRFTTPPKIMNGDGSEWDGSRIGNESVADVKFEVVDYGKAMYAGIYPRAIRVLDHKKYESQEFAPLDADDPYAKSHVSDAEFRHDFGLSEPDLDDEMPL